MTHRVNVSCDLEFDVVDHATIALHVAVADTAGATSGEQLTVSSGGGRPLDVTELGTEHGGRLHTFTSGAGRILVSYQAVVDLRAAGGDPVDATESIVGLRQSRYCPSDVLMSFAETEQIGTTNGTDRGREVAEWVHRRLLYDLSATGSFDTAIDTLLAGRGVCRDFAHLTIALCRALGIPARLVSAYAPGLWPMDFHAVVEVVADGTWVVLDPTRLAPRSSLVRIGTGRDASDTAFSTTLSGQADLVFHQVGAWVDGDFPFDDHTGRVLMP